MDSKRSTADVAPLKGVGRQGKKLQGADKDAKTKIAEGGKNIGGKLFILSVIYTFKSFLLTD